MVGEGRNKDVACVLVKVFVAVKKGTEEEIVDGNTIYLTCTIIYSVLYVLARSPFSRGSHVFSGD